MALTIDQLEIQIASDAGNATTGIDRLASSLQNLGSKLTFTSKLSTFAKSVEKISSAVNKLDTSRISALATSLSAIANVGKINLTSTINQLKKIPEVAKEFNTIDMGSFTSKLTDMANALVPLNTQLNSVKSGLSGLPQEVNRVVAASDKYTSSAGKANHSTGKLTTKLVGMISNFRTLYGAFKSVASLMAGWFNESNDYIETLNLFNVTMGDGADAAYKYAESVQKLIGIDIAEWMQYQGTFKQLTSGFGVASKEANVMSQNLTQLSYDLASFFNTDVETAFDKLSSAMSGQVKGLREFGIDTTVASLQEYALAKGIDKKVRSMTQAEKSLLRYNYIMEKSTIIQGDMARTLVTPSNAMRILTAQLTQMKRALGNIVSVLVARFIPYVQAMVEIITDAANALADFFGFELPTIDYSGLDTGGFADSFEDAEGSLDGVSGSLKEIKKQLMGFDELNIISNPDDDSSSSDSGSGAGGLLGGMEPLEYDFLKNLDTSKLDEAKEKLKDILWYIVEIAGGFLAWKLSKSFLGSLGGLMFSLGIGLAIDSIREVITDGLSWESVIKGTVAGALVGAGIGLKFGGPMGALLGATIGIGVSLLVQGITSMLSEGITVENVVTTITGALGSVAAIVGTVKFFNGKTKAATPELQTATETIENASSGTSNLTSKLKNLATNLGWGILIIAEVAVAAGIIVGAIWGLGVLLEQVGIAWQPVIDNGTTVAIAMGIGVGILAAIGVVTALLGTLGGAMAGQLGIGIAMLALIGAAAAIFIAEIWLVGIGLNEIGKAWQPVLDNGETIATGIGIGTGLLIGIGVVTAALGAATVATAGALPLAIALGTALLVELGIAFVAFVESLVEVADQLSQNLHPALNRLNAKLPELSDNMEDFTDYMKEFAGHVVSYTKSSAISGFSATVDSIIKFFTKDPIKSLANDANKQYGQAKNLNEKLRSANPELDTAISLMKKYYTLLEEIERLTEKTNNISLANGMFISMKEVGKNLVTGFVAGMKSQNSILSDGIKSVLSGALTAKVAQDYGKEFGKKLSTAIANAMNIGKIFNTISISLNVNFTKWVSSDKEKVYKALGLSGWPTLNWYAYANGGFPSVGEMFIAREAGPELVGNIGRKTAVANNDQIVSGIESGVYRAMVAANANRNSGGTQTIRIINEIDGDVVGEKVIQYHNGRVIQTGVSPLLV